MIFYNKDRTLARAHLPESRLGDERCVAIELDHQVDAHYSFWSGTIDGSVVYPGAVGFQIAHSKELYVMAALIGYSRELGIDESATRNTFLDAGASVLKSEPTQHWSNDEDWLNDIAQATESHHDSQPDLGLKCIVSPMSSQPGRHLESTGLYLGHNDGEDLVLVFAPNIQDSEQGQFKVPFRTIGMVEICEVDVPVIAEMLCGLTSGDNSKDMASFLTRQFLEPA